MRAVESRSAYAGTQRTSFSASEPRSNRSGAIDALEQKRDALIQSVEPLGVFTALDVPDRTGPTWSQRKGVKR